MRIKVSVQLPQPPTQFITPISNLRIVSVVLGGLPGPEGPEGEPGPKGDDAIAGDLPYNPVLLFENAIA